MMEPFLLTHLAAMPLQEKERLIQLVLTNVSDAELARVVWMLAMEVEKRKRRDASGLVAVLPDTLFG